MLVIVGCLLTLPGCSAIFGEERDVRVPDVTGMTVQTGADRLQSLGFCITVEQGTGPDRGSRIDGQRTEAGAVLREGNSVVLVTNTVDDLVSTMREIGDRNEGLSCETGAGIGGSGPTPAFDGTGAST